MKFPSSHQSKNNKPKKSYDIPRKTQSKGRRQNYRRNDAVHQRLSVDPRSRPALDSNPLAGRTVLHRSRTDSVRPGCGQGRDGGMERVEPERNPVQAAVGGPNGARLLSSNLLMNQCPYCDRCLISGLLHFAKSPRSHTIPRLRQPDQRREGTSLTRQGTD